MQELPDQHLNAEIARALKFRPVVTPLQKQNARDRLLMRAAEQTMLPPLMVVETERIPLRERAQSLGYRTLRILHFLLLDSSMYERARCPSPRLYEFYNAHGRYAYTIIHMSA